MNQRYDNAALPNGFLVKLNDAGIHLETQIIESTADKLKTKRYTLTKRFYDFNNDTQEIKYRETWGVALEMPLNISTQETVRLLSATMTKLQPSPFNNEIYRLYHFKG